MTKKEELCAKYHAELTCVKGFHELDNLWFQHGTLADYLLYNSNKILTKTYKVRLENDPNSPIFECRIDYKEPRDQKRRPSRKEHPNDYSDFGIEKIK